MNKYYFIVIMALLVACKKEPVEIGLGQFISSPSNNLIVKNVVDTVKKEYSAANFELLNAEGDPQKLGEIAEQLAQNGDLQLRVAVDSPVARSFAEKSGAPIIYGGVTNPESAGLFGSRSPITGYTDAVSVETAIEDIMLIMPNLDHLGQINSINEPNSNYINFVINYRASVAGISSTSGNVIHNPSQVADIVNSLTASQNPVEALYLANSSYLAQNLSAIVSLAGNIPVFSSDPVSAEGTGVVFAYGADYAKIGQAMGQLILQFIKAKTNAERDGIFIEQARNLEGNVEMYADQEAAKKYGLTIPAEILDQIQ